MSACRSLEKDDRCFWALAELSARWRYLSSSAVPFKGIACDQIEEVFRAVEAGTSQFGIVPMENSTEGSVNRTLDALLRTSLSNYLRSIRPVHHNLLTKSGACSKASPEFILIRSL